MNNTENLILDISKALAELNTLKLNTQKAIDKLESSADRFSDSRLLSLQEIKNIKDKAFEAGFLSALD